MEALLLTGARGGQEEGRMRGLDVARGQAGGESDEGERTRLGGDDGGLLVELSGDQQWRRRARG